MYESVACLQYATFECKDINEITQLLIINPNDSDIIVLCNFEYSLRYVTIVIAGTVVSDTTIVIVIGMTAEIVEIVETAFVVYHTYNYP